jgi:hypothetical protein
MRRLSVLVLFCVLGASAAAQNVSSGFDLSNYGVRIEPAKRLIVVLAALEAAESTDASGKTEKLINTPLSAKGSEFRAQLLRDNASLNDDLKRRIGSFVYQYKKRRPKATDAQIVAPFISMAYVLSPVPDLTDPPNTGDLPGPLLDVLDFAPLAREFYRRSGIAAKLDDYVKLYRAESDGILRTSAREMVSDLLEYLHTRPQLFFTEKIKVQTGRTKNTTLEKTETRTHERHFFIVPEMLAPQGDVNFFNVRDDYYVILPPDKDVSFSEVRRAFLQFVADPLVLGVSREMITLRAWTKSRLDDRRKADPSISPDIVLATSRSLAAAIDIRQGEFTKGRIATEQARRKLATLTTDAEKSAVTADLERYKQSLADDAVIQRSEDYDRGLVLVFFFDDKLREIENGGFDIAASLKDIIVSFDELKETARLTTAAEAKKRALTARAERRNSDVKPVVAENPVTKRLLDIQKMIDAKDFAAAQTQLTALSKNYPADARVYYNLGRISGLLAAGTSDPDVQARRLVEAKEAYTNVIEHRNAETDRALLSLTFVALARIYEHFDDNDAALKLYDAAIQLGDVAGGARGDAIAGKQRLLNAKHGE